MILNIRLILCIFVFILHTTTDALAVVGHPAAENLTLSKQEKRKLKRQQKLLNWAAKIQRNKLGEYVDQFEMLADSTSCDTIVLNNGKQMTATIFNINNKGIEYLRCDQPNRTKVILSQRAVKEIRYQNGDVNDLASIKSYSYSSSPSPQGSIYYDSQMKNAKTIGILVGILCGTASLFGLLGLLILSLTYIGKERAIRRYAMKHAWIAYGAVIGLILAILLLSLLLNL